MCVHAVIFFSHAVDLWFCSLYLNLKHHVNWLFRVLKLHSHVHACCSLVIVFFITLNKSHQLWTPRGLQFRRVPALTPAPWLKFRGFRLRSRLIYCGLLSVNSFKIKCPVWRTCVGSKSTISAKIWDWTRTPTFGPSFNFLVHFFSSRGNSCGQQQGCNPGGPRH